MVSCRGTGLAPVLQQAGWPSETPLPCYQHETRIRLPAANSTDRQLGDSRPRDDRDRADEGE